MSFRTMYLRTRKYVQRHGLKSSLKRLWRETRNKLRYDRDIIYWRDLHQGDFDSHPMPEGCHVDKFDKISQIPDRLIRRIAELYSEELLRDYIRNRFEKGAHLWCMRNDTEDIGYLWSIEGRTMKPNYYFPLMARDVHLDDGFIFPPYRGYGIFYALNNHIFKRYKNEGFDRVYQEVAEWNTASIKSAEKNGFKRIGLAKKRFRRGKCKVTWWL